MGWTAQYFTTIIIEGNTPQTGIFIYNGTPSLGTLIGSWAASAGQDAFGNTYPAGINVTQGNLTGVGITNAQITASNILSSILTNPVVNQGQINQGQILETTIIFDSGGGVLFGYTTSTTTVNQGIQGSYTWTSPITGTASITCIGAGGGGNGGSSANGGGGGGGGECAQEPNYPVTNGTVFSYTVGAGGTTSVTGAGNGGDGGDTFFNTVNQVYANGGNGDGTPGTGSTNTVHFDGGSGGTSNGNTGGASGGNSGNPLSKGNNGKSPTGATGATSPAAQSGSGTGGTGGNNLANGTGGGGPGGGGGGAGAGGSGVTTLTKVYEPVYTASYYGPDAANPNQLRSTSTMYQGGETASGGSFNGNQRSVMVFNNDGIGNDFAGYTMTGAVLKITNQHSWYNSGMSVEIDEGAAPTKYPPSAPGTWLGNQNQLFISTIGEGASKSYTLPVHVASDLQQGLTNFLGLGAFVANNHPYNLNYYGYFTGGHNTGTELTLTGQIGTGTTTTSGFGSDGGVIITYSSASAINFALSPVAGTDPNGNAFAAGYTGPVNIFDPNASPAAVEGWHSLTLANGWTKQGFARYKLIGYNLMLVELQVNDSSATSGTMFNMPAGYTASTGQFPFVAVFNNTSGAPLQNVAILQIGTGAGAGVTVLDWAKQGKQYHGNIFISLD